MIPLRLRTPKLPRFRMRPRDSCDRLEIKGLGILELATKAMTAVWGDKHATWLLTTETMPILFLPAGRWPRGRTHFAFYMHLNEAGDKVLVETLFERGAAYWREIRFETDRKPGAGKVKLKRIACGAVRIAALDDLRRTSAEELHICLRPC